MIRDYDNIYSNTSETPLTCIFPRFLFLTWESSFCSSSSEIKDRSVLTVFPLISVVVGER